MFNILVAEDDASACRLMCKVLRQAGYQPFPAGDGAQALALMEHRHIDLAVVDLTMPQMDGLTFTRTVREGGSSLPILMVTARVAQADKREGFRAGTTIWSSPSTRRRCSGASRRCCADRAVPPSSG